MKRFAILTVTLGLLLVLAQDGDVSERIITIDFSGGKQQMENLRYGPISYEHPEPEGIIATVSNLTIYASKAGLRGPEPQEGEERVTISQAQGQRVATFTDGVRVERGRLNATGPDITYSEITGLGVLQENASIEVAPKEEGGDPVFISANSVEFNVDTDVSISRGDVTLDNGNQRAEADEIEYEEERTLGVLRCEDRQCVVTRTDEDGNVLTITADEIRAINDTNTLYATGNAVVVDGTITTMGDEVFFDDELQLAEIIGNPAESVDEDGGTVRAARIQQDIEFDVVEPMNEAQASSFDAGDFALLREQ